MANPDATTLDRLYALIASRKGSDTGSSYTAQLFAQGGDKIARKLGEEAIETVIEGVRGNAPGIVAESADLLYHLLVLWAASGVTPEEVWRALEARSGTSGIVEKKSRPAS
jgi:phosphoribosyl-ATP pyrophosphohydrolase